MIQIKKFCVSCDRNTLSVPTHENKCSGCGEEYAVNGHGIGYYVQKYRTEKGIKNFIPLIPGTKKPALDEYAQYFTKVYDGPFEDNQNLGIMTGPTNDNLVSIDNDSGDKAEAVLTNVCPKTWTVQTGKKGTHRHIRVIDQLPPPCKLTNDNNTIEIFTGQRLMVTPPSIHPDTNRPYLTVDDSPIAELTLEEFNKMLKLLELEGWTVKKNEEREKAIEKIAAGKITPIGGDRHFDILSFISTETLLHSKHKMPLSFYETIGLWAHENFAAAQYDKSEVLRLVHDAYSWAHDVPDHDKEQEYNRLKNEGPANDKEIFSFIELLVTHKKIVELTQIKKHLTAWLAQHKMTLDTFEVKEHIESVWSSSRVWPEIKRICFESGKHAQHLIFAPTQTIEAACWLIGCFCIKRVELTGELIYFNGMHYERNAEEFIRRQARGLFTKSTNNQMKEVFSYIEDQAPVIKSTDLEKHAHLKALNNGTYDIKKGEFVPTWNPDNIILNLIPHNYNDSAKWEKIKEKLTEIISDNGKRQTYLDFLSICLLPFAGIDYQFIGQGVPGTGKSQLTRLAEMALGTDNVSWSAIHVLAADKTVQIDCAFKMLNIDPDLSDDDLRHIDTAKKWITQDKFTARSIYAHSITFRPWARLMSMANGLYEITNEDDAKAMYDRTQIVQIEKRFRGEEGEIKNVFESVATTEELEGLITYLLANAHEIHKNQKTTNPQTSKEIEDIWNVYGNKIKAFKKKWIKYENDAHVASWAVWDKFQYYAREHGIKVKTKNHFYEKFDEVAGGERVKIRLDDKTTTEGYTGFRLYTDEEMDELEQTKLKEHQK